MYFYDRKHEKAETARNEINLHFSTTGLGGPNGGDARWGSQGGRVDGLR